MSVAEPTVATTMTPPPKRPVPARVDPYENPPTDTSFEVIDGVIVEKTMSAFEQYIAGLLFSPLQQHCLAADIGRAFIETKFHIPGTRNDRQPDVAFLSYERWAKDRPASRRNAWPIAPDLAVEFISPTDRMFSVFEKLEEYFIAGVREVWHVLSNTGKVYCYSSPTQVRILTRADELTGDPVVPGFRMALADLFPPAEDPSAAEG